MYVCLQDSPDTILLFSTLYMPKPSQPGRPYLSRPEQTYLTWNKAMKVLRNTPVRERRPLHAVFSFAVIRGVSNNTATTKFRLHSATSRYVNMTSTQRSPNTRTSIALKRAVRKAHFKLNRAFKVIQGHPYWCRQESRTVRRRNVQLIPTLFVKPTKI